MVKTLAGILTIVALSLIYCGAGSDRKQPKPETPQALQDHKTGAKILGSEYRTDIMEGIYAELVEKSEALKALENNLVTVQEKPDVLREKFEKYNDKSSNYYNSSKYKAAEIQDSLLRKKMLSLIELHTANYANKTSEFNSLLKHISQNQIALNDQHTVLKIVLTLSVMTDYQNQNLPDKKECNALLMEQDKMLEQIKSATPKH